VFYSFEMVLVGVILLGAMAAAGLRIWMKNKKESLESIENEETKTDSNS